VAPDVTTPVEIREGSAATITEATSLAYNLSEDGSAIIDFSETRAGLSAARSIFDDETTSLAERSASLEQRIRRRMPLISDLTWANDNDGKNHTWKQSGRFKAEFASKPISRTKSLVAPDLLSEIPRLEPWEEGSEGWFPLAPKSLRREFRLNPPSGWEPSEVPPDWAAKNGNGEATVRYRREGASVIGEVQLILTGGILDRAAYLEARGLLRETISAERRPVVFARPAPAKTPSPAAPTAP
jgi:hypothetical protein